MRILALDAALARGSAGVVLDGVERATRIAEAGRGQAALLPQMVEGMLAAASVSPLGLDFVAVTVGPGSFTGLRAALSVAHGLSLGAGCALVGVTVGEALAQALPRLGGRVLWSVIDTRRGGVYLERLDRLPAAIASVPLDALPPTGERIAVAGDAAPVVAARLAARGVDVMLTDARVPRPRDVAAAAVLRWRGELPPLAAQPLYVDPPEARPAPALRPPPA